MTLRLWVVSVAIIYEYDTVWFLWQSSTCITLRLSMVSVAIIYVYEKCAMVTKTRTASRAENYIISTHSLKNLIPSSICLLESSLRPVIVVTISRGTKLILTALIVSSTLEWEYTGTDNVQLQACAGKPVAVVHL